MMALENHDNDGDYIYMGEVSKYDNTVKCGKGIRVVTGSENRAILMGWFRNGVFTGHGRNIFEESLTYYEGEFFNYKQNGEGTLKFIDGSYYTGQFRSG